MSSKRSVKGRLTGHGQRREATCDENLLPGGKTQAVEEAVEDHLEGCGGPPRGQCSGQREIELST